MEMIFTFLYNNYIYNNLQFNFIDISTRHKNSHLQRFRFKYVISFPVKKSCSYVYDFLLTPPESTRANRPDFGNFGIT